MYQSLYGPQSLFLMCWYVFDVPGPKQHLKHLWHDTALLPYAASAIKHQPTIPPSLYGTVLQNGAICPYLVSQLV